MQSYVLSNETLTLKVRNISLDNLRSYLIIPDQLIVENYMLFTIGLNFF